MQPHRYTRLRDNFDGFVASLDEADIVVLTDVYAAGESAIEGASSERLAEALRERKPQRPVHFHPDLDPLAGELAKLARPGDLVITLGAGNVTRVGPRLVELLEAR